MDSATYKKHSDGFPEIIVLLMGNKYTYLVIKRQRGDTPIRTTKRIPFPIPLFRWQGDLILQQPYFKRVAPTALLWTTGRTTHGVSINIHTTFDSHSHYTGYSQIPCGSPVQCPGYLCSKTTTRISPNTAHGHSAIICWFKYCKMKLNILNQDIILTYQSKYNRYDRKHSQFVHIPAALDQ